MRLPVPSFQAICFDWLPDGSLVVVSPLDGLLLRRAPDGSLRTHAQLRGLFLGVWNEVVVDGRGNSYVNGGGFDVLAGEEFATGIVALVNRPAAAARRSISNVLREPLVYLADAFRD